MWNDRYSAEGLSLFGRATFDPMTLAVGATVAGGAITAAGTLAGGGYAAQAGRMQRAAAESEATQLEQNASQAFAAGQRKALDTQFKTKMALSSLAARAGASGVNAASGSPAEVAGEVAQRGSYQALMDMFNGESEATGLRNKAAGVRYSGRLAELEGEEEKNLSYYKAAGTLAGSVGSAFSTYGKLNYPTFRGAAGAGV